jgi:hypothetical protein
MRRSPPRQQGFILAVIKHQQPRQGTLPGGLHELHLVGEAQGVKRRMQGQSPRPAAGRNLRGHRGCIREAQPEDAPAKELAVAVDELAGQLRLAHPA